MAANKTLMASSLPEAAVLLLTAVLGRIGAKSPERKAFRLQKDKDRWDEKQAKKMIKFFEQMLKSPLSPLMKRIATAERYPDMTEEEIKKLFPDG